MRPTSFAIHKDFVYELAILQGHDLPSLVYAQALQPAYVFLAR